MKKCLTLLFLPMLMVILFSCTNGNSIKNNDKSSEVNSDSIALNQIPPEKLDSIVNIITGISANDFYKNQQPAPVDFKNVILKYIKKSNGEELYILCGLFVTTDKQEIQFATIKNSNYEQWIGPSALTYCQDSKEIPYTRADLSTMLKDKFDALEK